MNPVREWKPKELNLKVTRTAKEKNIREYLDYVSKLDGFNTLYEKERLVAISAGEGDTPVDELYGISELKLKIYTMEQLHLLTIQILFQHKKLLKNVIK